MKGRKEEEKQEVNLDGIPTEPWSHTEFQFRLLYRRSQDCIFSFSVKLYIPLSVN